MAILTIPSQRMVNSTAYGLLDDNLIKLTSEFTTGLEAATQATFNAKRDICTPKSLYEFIRIHTGLEVMLDNKSISQRNSILANLVRDVANEHGWLEGWKLLVQASPDCGINDTLMQDIETGDRVYKSLSMPYRHKRHPPMADVQFHVVSTPKQGCTNEIGPKSIGGHRWESDIAFKDIAKKWMAPEDLKMGPCPLFAWMGVAKKVAPSEDPKTVTDFWTAQLLGIVDYGFDKDEKNMPGGIKNAIERTARMALEQEGRMRGVGLVGLMMMDQQMSNRQIQYSWAAEGKGSFITGPAEISPRDFACASYIDCAGLAPFAYETGVDFSTSRKGMFTAVLFANMHDLLYDIGSSSRISCASYAYSTGAFQSDLPQAFIVGMIDDMALDFLHGRADRKPTYGENALFATCVWNIFNVRYRAWERFIKYTRLIMGSKSPCASVLMNHARNGMVLVPQDPDADIGEAFASALYLSRSSKPVCREALTDLYTLPSPRSILDSHGLNIPELCGQCALPFSVALFKEQDTVQAIPGLPSTVIDSDPVSIAAAIRRGALWATDSTACCDNCACDVGYWANLMSDRAVVASMEDEQKMSVRDWLLQNYVMGCVAFSPLRLISILAGFDVSADIRFAVGAMGESDVVDC